MSIDFQLMLRMSRGDPCSLISLIRPICQCPGCELSPSLSGFAHIKSDSNRSSEYLNRSVGLAGAQFRLFESSLQAVHLSTQSGVFACSAYEERLVRSKTAGQMTAAPRGERICLPMSLVLYFRCCVLCLCRINNAVAMDCVLAEWLT